MTYPGGKNGAGVYQRIINQMPPHDTYVEGFLGSGAVLRHKRPAWLSVGVDRSEDALDLCDSLNHSRVEWLRVQNSFQGFCTGFDFSPGVLLYLDPPYLPETRKGGDVYGHEMSQADHVIMLRRIVDLDCMVMLSGYPSVLYDDMLTGWRRIDYRATTRRGMVDECLWANFPEPTALHDYSYLGDDFRARERIKRKKARWTAKFQAMGHQERLAIMDALTGSG